ncbi:MAG: hypothetical protein ACRDRN_16400 [Sciscionella sp.]
MSETKRALVLHVTGGGEPIMVAIDPHGADELAATLPKKLLDGEIESITAADGSPFVVNFSQVIAAHVDATPPMSQPYGSIRRE